MARTDSQQTIQTPKWRRRPEHRPRQIIEAAQTVFGRDGLAKARLEDIARAAGVSKGTIYLYFPNKEELFKEMIRQTAIAAIEEEERGTLSGSPTEQLRMVMRRHWELVRSPTFGTVFRLVIGELNQFPDLAEFYATEVLARGMRLLTGIIGRGITTGEFREIDPAVAARIFAAIFGINGLWCSRRDCFPVLRDRTDAEVFEELVEFFLYALAPGNAASPQADGSPPDSMTFNNCAP